MLSTNSFVAKYDWLLKHFPFLNPNLFVFCGDKSTVKADYLIDDHIYPLQTFQDRGIMFAAPHNYDVSYDLKMNNWQELRTYFLEKANVKLRSEEHTSELQSRGHLVCRLLLEKKNEI